MLPTEKGTCTFCFFKCIKFWPFDFPAVTAPALRFYMHGGRCVWLWVQESLIPAPIDLNLALSWTMWNIFYSSLHYGKTFAELQHHLPFHSLQQWGETTGNISPLESCRVAQTPLNKIGFRLNTLHLPYCITVDEVCCKWFFFLFNRVWWTTCVRFPLHGLYTTYRLGRIL